MNFSFENQGDSFQVEFIADGIHLPLLRLAKEGNRLIRMAGTVMFECKVQGHSKPYFFKFKDCKFVKVIQEYIKRHESLRYLLRDTISNDGEKRRSVGKYSNPSSAYISNF